MAAPRWLVLALLVQCLFVSAALAAAVGQRHQRSHQSPDYSAEMDGNGPPTHGRQPHKHRHHHQQQQNQHQPAFPQLPQAAAQQQQQQATTTRRVLDLTDTAANIDIFREFNLTPSDLINRTRAHQRNSQAAATQRPIGNGGVEQQKIDIIKEQIMLNIGRNISPSSQIDYDAPGSSGGTDNDGDVISSVAFYPSCNHHDEAAAAAAGAIGPNTSRMYFPQVLLGRLGPRTRLDVAVLRIYQIAHDKHPAASAASGCSEPNDRVFFTVSVLERRGNNKDAQFRKRNCDMVTRNTSTSGWLELDVVEVLRQWQKQQRGRSTGGGGSGGIGGGELMLLVDVHDQFDNQLNATRYFEPMDCQAYHLPTPWALYDQSAVKLSPFELPHVPRLDLTTRQHVQQPGRERALHHSYADRFHRLEQLAPTPDDRDANDDDSSNISSSSGSSSDDNHNYSQSVVTSATTTLTTTRRNRHSSSRQRKQRRAHHHQQHDHHQHRQHTATSTATEVLV